MYFDDLPKGFTYETGAKTLTEEDILGFARQHDPQYFHTDPEAAKNSPYGGLIASGFQTMISAFKLTLAEGGWAGASMGSPGMSELRWILPVRPGDSLHVEAEVIAARASGKKPDRGYVTLRHDVLNQTGALAMTYTSVNILRRRPDPAG